MPARGEITRSIEISVFFLLGRRLFFLAFAFLVFTPATGQCAENLFLHRAPALVILLSEVRNYSDRIDTHDTLHPIADLLLLGKEQLHALLEVAAYQSLHRAAIGSDDLGEKIPTHDRLSTLFLLADDLKQYAAGDVSLRFLVDNHKIDFIKDQSANIGECDVTAFLRVVQPAIGVLFNYTCFAHGRRNPLLLVRAIVFSTGVC